jgi:hypothetical protein
MVNETKIPFEAEDLLDNGEFVCKVFEFNIIKLGEQDLIRNKAFGSGPGNIIPLQLSNAECEFITEKMIDDIITSTKLEIRYKWGETTKIYIDLERTHPERYGTRVVAVLEK